MFAAVALGAWAARRRLLDEPERHRALLRRTAMAGLLIAVLGGLPLALTTAGLWAPPVPVLLLVGGLHSISGYAGGLGYAALFGLLAIRITGRGGPGPIARAVQAGGQRSLSCYLAQSVVVRAAAARVDARLGRVHPAVAGQPARARGVDRDRRRGAGLGPGRLARAGRGAAAPVDVRPAADGCGPGTGLGMIAG